MNERNDYQTVTVLVHFSHRTNILMSLNIVGIFPKRLEGVSVLRTRSRISKFNLCVGPGHILFFHRDLSTLQFYREHEGYKRTKKEENDIVY